MKKSFKKLLSLLLCICIFASITTVSAFPVSANYGDEIHRPLITDIVPSDIETNRYYFYMPQDWRNEYNDAYDGVSLDSCRAGIYWWEDSYNCEKAENQNDTGKGWPGYVINETDPSDHNIFVADVPKDVVTIMFNNTVDGGGDPSIPVYDKSIYTRNIPVEYYSPDEDGYGFYPNGTETFDGMIYVIDPKWVEINEYGDRRITRGVWFYYYGNGEYGINKEPVEGEVYRDGEFPAYPLKVSESVTVEVGASAEIYCNYPTATFEVANSDIVDVTRSAYSDTISVVGRTPGTTTITFTVTTSSRTETMVCVVTVIKEPTIDDQPVRTGDFSYTILEDGTASIIDYYGNDSEIEIPKNIDGYSVTNISAWAFSNCKSMTSVTIPDSVVNIDEGAFRNCINLESVVIPDSVTTIGTKAFWGCTSLKSVTLGSNVSTIKKYAFCQTALSEITIPKSVKEIGDEAFGYNATSNDIYSTYPNIDFVIYGYPKTTAEKYARTNYFDFVSLSGEEETTPVQTVAKEIPSCGVYDGTNVDCNNYYNWNSVICSYLSEDSGLIVRFQADAKKNSYIAEYYDSKYQLRKTIEIEQELPIFGAFYSSSDYYFILSGQINKKENDDIEVFRVTKYDKDWNRLGSAGLYGANTTYPFSAGSARITESGDYLLIRTCHGMYASSDGVSHQANVTIQYDISKNKITDSYYTVFNISNGYVSHSFNQFVKADESGLVTVDHGDAYPRSVVLVEYNNEISSGKFNMTEDIIHTNLLSIPGRVGDNYTGVSVGGFEISDSAYIVAINSINLDKFSKSETRNIVVLTKSKSDGSVTQTQITDYAEGTTSAKTPQLVKVSNDKFILLWGRGSKVYYTQLNSNGEKVGKTYSISGHLSDCAPIVLNDKLVWYTWSDKTTTFYEISLSDLSDAETIVNTGSHSSTKTVNKKSATLFAKGYSGDKVCNKCGNVAKKGHKIAKKSPKFSYFKIKTGKKKITINYKKIKSVKGFQVRLSSYGVKTKKKTFAASKSVSKKIKNLKASYYFIEFRVYKKENGKKVYSSWSASKFKWM